MAYGSFLNLEKLFSVNRDQSERMGADIAQPVADQGAQVQNNIRKGANNVAENGGAIAEYNSALPGQADDVSRRAKMLNTTGGREQAASDLYGKEGGYGQSERGFDAMLAGGSQQLDSVSSAYSDLSKKLGAAQVDASGQYANKLAAQNTPEMQAASAFKAKHQQWSDQKANFEQQLAKYSNGMTPDQQVRVARNAGYHGGDYEGAARWYQAQFGQPLSTAGISNADYNRLQQQYQVWLSQNPEPMHKH